MSKLRYVINEQPLYSPTLAHGRQVVRHHYLEFWHHVVFIILALSFRLLGPGRFKGLSINYKPQLRGEGVGKKVTLGYKAKNGVMERGQNLPKIE